MASRRGEEGMIQYKYLPEMDVVGETNPACKGGENTTGVQMK